jgi:hypothetical protein
MTPAELALWLTTAAHEVKDSHGFAGRPSSAVVEAIAAESIASPIGGNAQATAALVLVFAFRESSYRTDVRGDGGRSCGLLQTPCAITPLRDARAQVRIGIELLKRSALASPDGLHPWATYASGSPTNAAGIRISDARAAEAKALLVTVDGGGK